MVEGVPSEVPLEDVIIVKPYEDNVVCPVVYARDVMITVPQEDATDCLVAIQV